MKPEAVIFDVDGTLVNVDSVRHHVLSRPKNFDAFHAGTADCPPIEETLEIYRRQRELGRGIIVVTARKERWSMVTLLWLKENEVEFDDLHMRGDKDNRPDFEVKRDILIHIRRRWDVVLAVDDNPSVIELWEEHDIETVRIPGWVEGG